MTIIFIHTLSGTLTIKIEDVNDNNPVFQKTLYRIAVPENSKPETSILNVVADDKDVNRTLIYELQGSYSITNYVTIDSNTGQCLKLFTIGGMCLVLGFC